MTLRRTPLHHQALQLIRDGQIVWQEALSSDEKDGVPRRSAGFRYVNDARLRPDLLVAAWEMRQAHLITVADGHLSITPFGSQRLSEWDATKVRRYA